MKIENGRGRRNGQKPEHFCYKDKIRCIRQIEDNDIRPLVIHNKARIIRDSTNKGIPLSVRKYEITLRTNIDFIFCHAMVKFVYDERTGYGEIQIPTPSLWALDKAYSNEDKGYKVKIEESMQIKVAAI
jgi:hypothetical protein